MKSINEHEITDDTQIIYARTVIMGSRNPTASGWHYMRYIRARNGGWICEANQASIAYWPSRRHSEWAREYEITIAAAGHPLVVGRPQAANKRKINVYKVDELAEDVKAKVIAKFRNDNQEFYWQHDYQATLDKFCEVFPIKWKTWDIYQGISYKMICDAAVSKLTGIRLQTYITNNFSATKCKYGKLLTEGDICGCPLTGFCADIDILKPINDFMVEPTADEDFEDVLYDCLQSWLISFRNDYETQQTDEYIIEHIQSNDYRFTAGGIMV